MTKRPLILSPSFVDRVREPGRFGDNRGGHGLSLLVKKTKTGRVSRSWAQRVRIGGKLTNKGLGSYPVITLSHARKLAMENRRALAEGRNPFESGIPNFREAFAAVVAIQASAWRGGRTEQDWRSSMDAYVLPVLGGVAVDKITPAHVLEVVRPLWGEKRATAKAVRRRVSVVCRWAIAQGFRTDDPAGPVLSQALPAKTANGVQHRRALPPAEVPAALGKIAASGEWLGLSLGLRFLVLTAARSGEVRGATWGEIDLEGRVWAVPAARSKTGKEHKVPLSGPALEVLTEARLIRNRSGLVFPSARGLAMKDATLSKAVRALGLDCTVHGFRSSFRDWAAESGYSREVCEQALAHVVGGVEGAYMRSSLFDRRRSLMEAWAQHLTRQAAKVIQLRA